jgi:primosomal replication protein N
MWEFWGGTMDLVWNGRMAGQTYGGALQRGGFLRVCGFVARHAERSEASLPLRYIRANYY